MKNHIFTWIWMVYKQTSLIVGLNGIVKKTGKQISNYKDIGDAEAQLASIMELTNST